MKTQILPSDSDLSPAIEALRAGDLVALPTETVYGLAADALNPNAVAKIFEAKDRPRFDPLIVHLPEKDWLERLTQISTADKSLVETLSDCFWPGPLTLVLPRRVAVPDLVAAGLATVAVRMSAHPTFQRIIREVSHPLAAPSANRFGRISPTRAADVLVELGGRIPFIVDGGATTHGIESTIVAVRAGALEIMRHGPITTEQLAEFGVVREAPMRERPEAPGQLASHYAPHTPLRLTRTWSVEQPAGDRVGVLCFRERPAASFAETRVLSRSGDLHEAAANLFRCLRELDAAQLDLIIAEAVPESGLGRAIMDRLRRAAASPRGRGTPR